MKRLLGLLCMLVMLLNMVLPAAAVETVPESTEAAEEAALQETAAPAEAEETLSVQPEEELLPGETIAEETVPAEETLPEEEILPEPEESTALGATNEVPLYYQTDYPDVRYGTGTIATDGCGITALAMVATYMTGYEYRPDTLSKYFEEFSGNSMERLEYASDTLQLPWHKAENFNESLQALKEGKVVIALMNSKSLFTNSQHFIVLAGINDEGKIMVNDPYAPNYTLWNLQNAFAEGFTSGDICCGYSGGWIYDKSAMPEEPFIYTEETVEVACRYPDVELTEEEVDLLARMVWVEAQGEPFEGQQAIAEVVLNRLVAGNFQSSVKGIIYAENQFRSAAYLDDAEPTQTQYAAVERALKGPYVLPVDVVFFATYPVNENVWGDIGGHTFCYQW